MQAPCTERLVVTHRIRYRPQQGGHPVGKLQERKLKTAVTDRNSIWRTWRGNRHHRLAHVVPLYSWPSFVGRTPQGTAQLATRARALEGSSKTGQRCGQRATRRMTNDTTRPHKKKSLWEFSWSSAGAQHRGHRGVLSMARGLPTRHTPGGDGPVLTDCRVWVVSIPGGWELADSGTSSIRNGVDSPEKAQPSPASRLLACVTVSQEKGSRQQPVAQGGSASS